MRVFFESKLCDIPSVLLHCVIDYLNWLLKQFTHFMFCFKTLVNKLNTWIFYLKPVQNTIWTVRAKWFLIIVQIGWWVYSENQSITGRAIIQKTSWNSLYCIWIVKCHWWMTNPISHNHPHKQRINQYLKLIVKLYLYFWKLF